jgi:hypothetical protein
VTAQTLMGEVKLPHRTRLAQFDDPETGDQVLMLYRWQGEYHEALTKVISAIRVARQSDTYKVYARSFLAFDTYADQHHWIRWDSAPARILEAYEGYMASLGAVVTINTKTKTREITASADTTPIDGQTPKAALTLKAVHEAMRAVYRVARELGLYKHAHPLDKVNADKLRAQAKRRDIAQAAQGIVKPGQPYRRDGDPGRYYLINGTEWVPRHVYWDSDIRDVLRVAFLESDATLRDQCVLELMLTGGVRLAESCATSLAGWIKGSHTSNLGRPASTRLGDTIWMCNKGDGHNEIKPTEYPPETLVLIRRYWAEERHRYDPLTPTYLEWLLRRQPRIEHTPELYMQFLKDKKLSTHVPVFLSRHHNGRGLSTSAFRQAGWAQALNHAGVYIRPHQIRHWYISHQLYWIAEMYRYGPSKDNRLYHQARIELGKRMGWKHPVDMLEIYDQISAPPPVQLMVAAAEAAEAQLENVAVRSASELYGLPRPTATLPKDMQSRLQEDLEDENEFDTVLRKYRTGSADIK